MEKINQKEKQMKNTNIWTVAIKDIINDLDVNSIESRKETVSNLETIFFKYFTNEGNDIIKDIETQYSPYLENGGLLYSELQIYFCGLMKYIMDDVGFHLDVSNDEDFEFFIHCIKDGIKDFENRKADD
jgi:hypothetical protein